MFLLLLGNQWGMYSSSTWKTLFNSIRTSISFFREELADRRAGPRTKSLLSRLDTSRKSDVGPAVSTSTLGLERDDGLGTSSIVLARQFDEEGGMSDRSASELGKDEDGESIAMEDLERDVKRKKTMKIKVETVAASELGAAPIPSGRRCYQ